MPTPKRALPTITVGQLREELQGYPDDYRLSFSGLTYYRLKQRADDLVQVEFNEGVHLDSDGEVRITFPEGTG